MDVNLLKRFNLAQDVNSLYKEVLRNCKNRHWYWHTSSGIWRSFDRLIISDSSRTRYECNTNDFKYVVEKWIKLT